MSSDFIYFILTLFSIIGLGAVTHHYFGSWGLFAYVCIFVFLTSQNGMH
jgi:hypothetical protein